MVNEHLDVESRWSRSLLCFRWQHNKDRGKGKRWTMEELRQRDVSKQEGERESGENGGRKGQLKMERRRENVKFVDIITLKSHTQSVSCPSSPWSILHASDCLVTSPGRTGGALFTSWHCLYRYLVGLQFFSCSGLRHRESP